ncbi:hypothetical protein J6590_053800 [Homalodisca vitripennis]|nr:hypothetical protein J6590_053800 [Homalodisca vitripennis]
MTGAENVALLEECKVLKIKAETLIGICRLIHLEIVGVPLTDQEDLYLLLAQFLGQYNLYTMVSGIAHRLPSNRKDLPPSIIEQSGLAGSCQIKRNLNTVHLSSCFQPAPVFVNEPLTARVKTLLSQAKEMVKEKQLACAWIKTTTDDRTKRVNGPDDLVSVLYSK